MTTVTPSEFEAFVREAERLLDSARAAGSANLADKIDKHDVDAFEREWGRYVKWLRAEVAAGRVLR